MGTGVHIGCAAKTTTTTTKLCSEMKVTFSTLVNFFVLTMNSDRTLPVSYKSQVTLAANLIEECGSHPSSRYPQGLLGLLFLFYLF